MKSTPLVAALMLFLGIAQAHISRSHEGVDNSLGGGKSLAHLLLSSPVKTHKDAADDHRASFLIPATDGIVTKAQHFAEESLFSGMEKRRRRRDSDDNVAVPIMIANSSKTLTSSAKVSVTNDQPPAVASPPKGPPFPSSSSPREPSPPRGPKKPREKLIGKEQPKPKMHPAPQDGNAKPEKSGVAHAHDTKSNSNNQPVPTNNAKVSDGGGKVEGQKSSSQGGKRERRATQSDKQRKAVKNGKTKGKSQSK